MRSPRRQHASSCATVSIYSSVHTFIQRPEIRRLIFLAENLIILCSAREKLTVLLLAFMKQTKRLGKSEISGERRSGREGHDAKESPSFEEINTTSIPMPIRHSLSFSLLFAHPCSATRPPFHPLPWCSRICAAFRELERYFEVRRPASIFLFQFCSVALSSPTNSAGFEERCVQSVVRK